VRGATEGRKSEGRRYEGGGSEAIEDRARVFLTAARSVASGFGDDDGAFLAGAIAYQIFFALIPLLALVIGIFGFVYGPDRAERELSEIVRSLLPAATGQETRIIGQLVQGRAISLGFGLVGTL